VRRAVAADEAGPVDREHDRQPLQRDVVDELIVARWRNVGIDRYHRPLAVAGETGRQGDRVLSAIATSK
jgi:hypothetical protein